MMNIRSQKHYVLKKPKSVFKMEFNESKERKKILKMYGIDPDLTDEQLKDYKTIFVGSLLDVNKVDEGGYIPVLEALKLELDETKRTVEEYNKMIDEDSKNSFSYVVRSIEVPFEKSEMEKAISDIENTNGFLKWLDDVDFTDKLIDSPNNLSTSNSYPTMEFQYFKIETEKFPSRVVICPNSAIDYLDSMYNLANANGSVVSEISLKELESEDSENIISIYQYLNSGVKYETVFADMIIDEDKTAEENKNLIDVPTLNDFFSPKEIVENFNSDSVFEKLNML